MIGAAVAPLVFLGGFDAAVIGAILWGLALGIHEAVMSAAVADLVPEHARARAYGLFTALFGIAWFAGSALAGAPGVQYDATQFSYIGRISQEPDVVVTGARGAGSLPQRLGLAVVAVEARQQDLIVDVEDGSRIGKRPGGEPQVVRPAERGTCTLGQ